MKEGAAMRESMEVMLMEAKVDLVFNGHVHAYVYIPTSDVISPHSPHLNGPAF